MGASLPDYDPRVIEQFAENLYRKASAFVVGSIVIGASLGAAFGAVPLTSLGASWPIPSIFGFATLMLGGIFGGAIGYVIGDTRSFGYRLQAQSALCQLQTERNTALLAKAILARVPMTARQTVTPPAPKTSAQPPAPPAAQQPVAPPPPPLAPPVQPPVAPQQEQVDVPALPPVTPPVSAARVA